MLDIFALDWQAIASGAQAVASLIVGIALVAVTRQIGISQTELTKGQNDLAIRTFNSQLFDRRYKIYDQISSSLLKTIMNTPVVEGQHPNDVFLDGMRHAKILFRPEVNNALDEIWAHIHTHNDILYRIRETKMSQDDLKQSFDDYHTELEWLQDRLNNMIDLFGDELKLGSKPQSSTSSAI